ncbi:MAG: carboxymuconolactone decarboxylase family protein [Bacilli bacterium]
MSEKKITQTAGRDQLGQFAPEFAHFNDDILFGEQWNNPALSTKIKCMITVTSLIASGIIDSSLKYHLINAKNNGVSEEEIAALISQVAFYAGWPKAWASFNLAKEVWNEKASVQSEKDRFQNEIFFPIGKENTGFAKYFTGVSYLYPVSLKAGIFNVTFEPGTRNFWHTHHAKTGGGQVLICIGGKGYYQAENEEPILMTPGTVIEIPANVRHWHGASPSSWFSHLAIEIPGTETSTEWGEPVNEEEYQTLK